MIETKIVKVKELGAKDANAHISITLTVPELSAQAKMGTYFRTVNHQVVTDYTVSFKEMKDIMKFHDAHTWKVLKSEVEKKYDHFFRNTVQLTTVTIAKEQDIDSSEEMVRIQVKIGVPEIKAEKNMGVFFRTVRPEVISECNISFKDMKEILKFHEAKSWKDLKRILEDKYDKYYRSIYFA